MMWTPQMIILDYSQIAVSNVMAYLGFSQVASGIDVHTVRNMILNSVRMYNSKYRARYGEMVIACDDRHSWRRKNFPYYKARRRSDKKVSKIDWDDFYNSVNTVKEELKKFFPYRVIQAYNAEADDVIGALVSKFSNSEDLLEEILIISGDKDFRQLQAYPRVKQFDPVQKEFVVCNNPKSFLMQQIIKGDSTDGIMNILSDDDTFVIPGKRQKQLRESKMEEFLKTPSLIFDDPKLKRNYDRNKELIDLSSTPPDIVLSVIEQYHAQKGKNKSQLLNYFIEKRLKLLIESIQDF